MRPKPKNPPNPNTETPEDSSTQSQHDPSGELERRDDVTPTRDVETDSETKQDSV